MIDNDPGTLAAYCGISPEYFDIRGQRHTISPESQKRLLAAMLVDLEADPAATLATLEDEDWHRLLPPVTVVQSGKPIRIALRLPATMAQQRLRWQLRLEDGNELGASFVPSRLPATADRVVTGIRRLGVTLELPPVETTGYHRLVVGDTEMPLIVVPPRCYQPDAVAGEGRVWGLAVQLYGVRSRRNWGVGDFTDLLSLVDMAADTGAGVVGINPLHAMFGDNPEHCSPYSPSSRSFLNTLYLDVEAIPEYADCEEAQRMVRDERFQARLRALRAEEFVDYRTVAELKRVALDVLFRHFLEYQVADHKPRAQAFAHFCAERGEALRRQALFEALQEHFRNIDAAIWGWPVWPEEYRDSDGAAVAEFAATHGERIDYFCWLQWLADDQLAAVGRRSWQRGLGIGLYQDLALGANPGGAEVWAAGGSFASGAYAGAPPDDFSPSGQNWGLPPFNPRRLRDVAYAPLIDILRANMRHAGALRIDHAMWLTRVFWVPAGMSAADGAYVRYPLDDLLGIVALESQRNRCMVIGEDLGTVPDGYREVLTQAGVLLYRPFLFERGPDGGFKPPPEYPRQALVALSTHDLPTLRGLWKGSDLDARAALGLFPDAALRESQIVARAQDRARLLMAIEREGLLPHDGSVHPVAVPDLTTDYVEAVHRYLARAPAQLMVVQPEDVLGIVDQVNLPGSRDDQHPNWRRRLPLNLEDWRDDARFARVFDALREERGTSVTPRPDKAATPDAHRTATIPRATYRLQFNRDFTFAQATAIVPYLAQLGISHVYASPYLKARPGSSHGYDIVDHSALNPEIGSPEDYEAFVATLKKHGMNQIIDVVPNHMGVMGADNAWWLDVLENGPASAHAAFFDIDWEPPNPGLSGKVLLAILGQHYGSALSAGELRLDLDAGRGELSIHYYDHRLPVDPATYPTVIGYRIERLASVLGENSDLFVELQTLLGAFAHLPPRMESDLARVADRQRDKEVHKRHLAALCETSADIVHHIADNIVEFNGRAHEPASFDLLHELIKAQGYRLSYWRLASDEINYRRFFDINDLAALRMEAPGVFDATHRFVLSLLDDGKADGLRIDHPDGLYDPGRYFAHLQECAGGRVAADAGELPLYLVIEKILADHERLPNQWPIHGATGYRFANITNALLVDASAARRMTRIYADFTRTETDFEELVYRAKHLIMDTALASELNVLANRLARIASASRDTCDYTLNGLREALAEVVACFPVYRTYIDAASLTTEDRRHIEWAVAVAKKRSTAADITVFDFVQTVLTTDIVQGRSLRFRDDVRTFAMRFQQFSAPVMAKGVEDTAFYRYHRLISLNEVGGDPRRFGMSVAAYHGATKARSQLWPHSLLATSTHDSKRSEDVRARISLLSEMPAAWKLMLRRWSRQLRSRKRKIDGVACPSANDEYLLYQTLLGTWPAERMDAAALDRYRARIERYMIKAVREAKVESSWINPDTTYEAALSSFIEAALAPGETNLFLADFEQTAHRLAAYGIVNSLAQTLLKLTVPGVPDIYQGCELWQFNLVDPDNRAPIDFQKRRELLNETVRLDDPPAGQLGARLEAMLADLTEGRAKLYLIWRTLSVRTRQPELFRCGSYLPLTVRGKAATHVCAFARRHGRHAMIVVVPRLVAKLRGAQGAWPLEDSVWEDTTLEMPGQLAALDWHEVLTDTPRAPGPAIPVADLLTAFPVALLIAGDPTGDTP